MQRIKNMLIQLMTLIFILLAGLSSADAGTCSSISRTNYSANQVLTSTQLNSDFNTVYGAANALDGGCVTDGTLEDGSLNTTDFAALLNGLQQGCKLLYSTSSVAQIDECIASVNGNFIKTTSATNVSMGCGDCSAEVASTDYYVYIKTGSSGTSLTGFFSTTAPGNDGYDGSGNKVVGRIYNDGSQDLQELSVEQWSTSGFRADYDGGVPVVFEEIVANNTAGQTTSAGAWNTVPLNTLSYGDGVATGDTDSFTVTRSGKYKINASIPLACTGVTTCRLKTRLYNTTDSSEILLGSSAVVTTPSSGGAATYSFLKGVVQLDATDAYEIQYYSAGTSTIGQPANNSGDVERYTQLFLNKVD